MMFFNTNTKPVWEWATKTLATGCNSGTSDSSCSKRKITLSFFSLPKLSSRRLKTVKSDQVKPDGTSATDFLEDPLDWEAIWCQQESAWKHNSRTRVQHHEFNLGSSFPTCPVLRWKPSSLLMGYSQLSCILPAINASSKSFRLWSWTNVPPT